MEKTKKKRINFLDVLIVLVIILAITAFFLRGKLLAFFEEDSSCVVTYSFAVEDLDGNHAAYLAAGTVLFNQSGEKTGDVLTVSRTAATDSLVLADGHTVEVQNGDVDIAGTVSATGYAAGSFIYLADGTMLIPGNSITVFTGEAVFVLRITGVHIVEENRAN